MQGLLSAFLIFDTLLLAALVVIAVQLRARWGAEDGRARMAREQREAQQAELILRRLREELQAGLSANARLMTTQIAEAGRTQAVQMEAYTQKIGEMTRSNEERLDRMRRTLSEELRGNDARMEKTREGIELRLRELQADNARQLDRMRETVDEKLSGTLEKRLGESFKLVNDRLEQVYKGLGEMQTLAVGVGDLKRVLTNVTTRGMWGEMQLGALLESILAPGQYDTNVSVQPGVRERVEFAIRLPGVDEGQPVYLPIDSKFPQEDYARLLEAQEAADPERAEQELKRLAAAIRVEAKRIRDKYIQPPYTTEFAILFLPVEGLYAQSLRVNGLIETLQRDLHVVIAGPTTLAALLNSLQMGFRTLAIQKRSADVWELLGAIKGQFGKFTELLEKTQHKLSGASNDLESATKRSRMIARKLEGVQGIEGDAERMEERLRVLEME